MLKRLKTFFLLSFFLWFLLFIILLFTDNYILVGRRRPSFPLWITLLSLLISFFSSMFIYSKTGLRKEYAEKRVFFFNSSGSVLGHTYCV